MINIAFNDKCILNAVHYYKSFHSGIFLFKKINEKDGTRNTWIVIAKIMALSKLYFLFQVLTVQILREKVPIMAEKNRKHFVLMLKGWGSIGKNLYRSQRQGEWEITSLKLYNEAVHLGFGISFILEDSKTRDSDRRLTRVL